MLDVEGGEKTDMCNSVSDIFKCNAELNERFVALGHERKID